MRTNQDWNHRVTLTALVHRIVEGLDTVTDFLQWRRQGVGQWRQPADPSSPCFTRNSVLDELSHSNFAIFFFLGQDKCPHRVRSHWPRKRTKFHKTQHVSTCNMWLSYGKNLSCHRCYVVPVLPLQLDILTADYLANTWLLIHIHMHQSCDLWSFDMFCLKQSVWASHQISSCKAVLSEKNCLCRRSGTLSPLFILYLSFEHFAACIHYGPLIFHFSCWPSPPCFPRHLLACSNLTFAFSNSSCASFAASSAAASSFSSMLTNGWRAFLLWAKNNLKWPRNQWGRWQINVCIWYMKGVRDI